MLSWVGQGWLLIRGIVTSRLILVTIMSFQTLTYSAHTVFVQSHSKLYDIRRNSVEGVAIKQSGWDGKTSRTTSALAFGCSFSIFHFFVSDFEFSQLIVINIIFYYLFFVLVINNYPLYIYSPYILCFLTQFLGIQFLDKRELQMLIFNVTKTITSLKVIFLDLVCAVRRHMQCNIRFLLPQMSCIALGVLLQFRINFKSINPLGYCVGYIGRKVQCLYLHRTTLHRKT